MRRESSQDGVRLALTDFAKEMAQNQMFVGN